MKNIRKIVFLALALVLLLSMSAFAKEKAPKKLDEDKKVKIEAIDPEIKERDLKIIREKKFGEVRLDLDEVQIEARAPEDEAIYVTATRKFSPDEEVVEKIWEERDYNGKHYNGYLKISNVEYFYNSINQIIYKIAHYSGNLYFAY